MHISYIGHASFLIESKTCSLVTDPFAKTIGIPFPKTQADIVTVSRQSDHHECLKNISGSPLLIDWPGEYQKNGVAIQGYQSFCEVENQTPRDESILFRIVAEGIHMLHLGTIGHMPSKEAIEHIGPVDVLFIPIGGTYTIDSTLAVKIIREIEPAIVIPMCYFDQALDTKMFGMLETVDVFIQKMGLTNPAPLTKLTIKHEDFLQEATTRIVVLQRS